MLKVFQTEILDPSKFVITLELVPGRYSVGKSVDKVMGIAKDAFNDGRVSAVSVTDNPGGNPSLSPDVLGHNIFRVGLDVIVHYTCRDLNRVGMESRALQLAMMGMKNLLALTGDYTGKGYGGQGAPVFDLESVNAIMLLRQLSDRLMKSGDPDGFFAGCAVSPFKSTEAECFVQYNKLFRKILAGAQFIITQLGYDARKFAELIGVLRKNHLQAIPTMGSVYVLNPKAAKIMNKGIIPGVVVPDELLKAVTKEWETPSQGHRIAIERAAKLGAVLKGLGYRGMHIGGIHKSFDTVGKILDRMQEIEKNWQEFYHDFTFPQKNGFYVFPTGDSGDTMIDSFKQTQIDLPLKEKLHYSFMKYVHSRFFTFESPFASFGRKTSHWITQHKNVEKVASTLEISTKMALLDCQHCGDCAIQHVGFLCPESQCPKHTRNNQCGGSRDGMCEVYPDKQCVWVRAYDRVFYHKDNIPIECIAPRLWELNKTNSWLNFHLKLDHQAASSKQEKSKIHRDCENDSHEEK